MEDGTRESRLTRAILDLQSSIFSVCANNNPVGVGETYGVRREELYSSYERYRASVSRVNPSRPKEPPRRRR